MFTRRKTRVVKVGDVRIGGGAPISIQSMTKTDTRDVSATIRQIKQLEGLGCDIIRAAVLDAEAARAIREIKKAIKIPLVADIHFHCRLAIEAIKNGADKIRLNPGNIKRKEDIAQVIRLAKKRKIPIRIGVNSGSIQDPSPLRLRSGQARPSPQRGEGEVDESPQRGEGEVDESPQRGWGDIDYSLSPRRGERERVRGMVEATSDYIKFFESLDFHDIIISLKASSVPTTINAYREMAKVCGYPFHLGVTAAGPSESGIIKSAVGIGTLLAEGIGDTIRVSLTGSAEDEVRVGKEILNSLGLKNGGVDIISCPTCGRCGVDLVKVVRELEKKLHPSDPGMPSRGPRDDRHRLGKHIRVAVMGCVVNGPGEARDADVGIAAGKNCGMLFKKGKIIRKIEEKDFVKILLEETDSLF